MYIFLVVASQLPVKSVLTLPADECEDPGGGGVAAALMLGPVDSPLVRAAAGRGEVGVGSVGGLLGKFVTQSIIRTAGGLFCAGVRLGFRAAGVLRRRSSKVSVRRLRRSER